MITSENELLTEQELQIKGERKKLPDKFKKWLKREIKSFAVHTGLQAWKKR